MARKDTTIDLAYTQGSDRTMLVGLSHSACLWLIGTEVSDLTPLAGLTGLRSLALYGAKVSDEAIADLQRSLPNLEIYL